MQKPQEIRRLLIYYTRISCKGKLPLTAFTLTNTGTFPKTEVTFSYDLCMYTKNSRPLHHSHREFRISQLIQLCIKYILIQTVKCLFHSGKRKCQIHTDCILHEERLAILPVNTNLIAFLSQLSDCHVVLL